MSHIEKVQGKEILDNLLERNIIRESESPCASPIVLVKKGEKRRLCIDFRVLNKMLAGENFPLPVIEDQLEIMKDKRYFSILDLKDAFYHISMAEESIPYICNTIWTI